MRKYLKSHYRTEDWYFIGSRALRKKIKRAFKKKAKREYFKDLDSEYTR